MAVLTGPVYVPNPTPQVQRYGLFTVAVGPMDLPGHAADGGITWLSASCGEAGGYEVNCLDSLATKGPFTDSLNVPTATPFVVVTGFECALVGISQAERTRLALEKLAATEQAAVESIFSQGSFGQSPSLANNTPAAADVGPAANFAEGFSQLEAAFYQTYGYPGVIHVPLAGGAIAQGAMIMAREARVWRTALGSAVSIGNYASLSPAGVAAAAGSVWIYITPPVAIWRSNDPFVAPIEGALDRTTNEVTTYVEREYVVAYDPCPVYATEAVLLEGI